MISNYQKKKKKNERKEDEKTNSDFLPSFLISQSSDRVWGNQI